uniref:Peptidase A1 domain-containing protein n=1 Tax=Chromera velia CCMP2878 TaxID=1169474 RepID=A0A0G4FRQ3_9ALVE|eukprot:Cvel_18435.t1-p1 / transcript=Cvel_18435.t1 / gene=Cvel_18435 / organism=Chromera_velia_CCMP2878 / gene_product=hypothetical protein / transcript_product=hypothetical protein / location=Cvel_scaffold1527:1682-2762(-) / protein_length=299 / sequence_SO=supercontig / SO=protein_coding / is_pseudo=false
MCESGTCFKHTRFIESTSTHQRVLPSGLPSLLSVEYLSGSVQGRDVFEQVEFDTNLHLNTTISLMDNIEVPFLEDVVWDGIIGLGLENDQLTERGLERLVDRFAPVLHQQGLRNQFSYWIHDNGGAIQFGGIKNHLKLDPDEPFQFASVTGKAGYWNVKVLGISKFQEDDASSSFPVPEQSFHDGGTGTSIVDTGTFLIYAPKGTLDNYLSELFVDECSDRKKLPSLLFYLEPLDHKTGGTFQSLVTLRLDPTDYVVEFENELGEQNCFLGIREDDAPADSSIGGWTFGRPVISVEGLN